MAKNNILQFPMNPNDKETNIIENPSLIQITNKTVRFGTSVYQFQNISGFGLGKVTHEKTIPTALITVLFISGFFLTITSANVWGIIPVALAIGGIALNTSQPIRYGLELYVNSGNNIIFVTKDLEGITRVVSFLHEFIENDLENTFLISIDENQISIKFSNEIRGEVTMLS